MIERFRWLFYRICSFIWRLFHRKRHKLMWEYFEHLEEVGKLGTPAEGVKEATL